MPCVDVKPTDTDAPIFGKSIGHHLRAPILAHVANCCRIESALSATAIADGRVAASLDSEHHSLLDEPLPVESIETEVRHSVERLACHDGLLHEQGMPNLDGVRWGDGDVSHGPTIQTAVVVQVDDVRLVEWHRTESGYGALCCIMP